MSYGLSEVQLQSLLAVFKRYEEIDSTILYGSRAMGTHLPYSDIDLTLTGNELDFRLLQKIEIDLDDLLLPYKIDLSTLTKIENEDLLAHIQRHGKIIYQKT